MKAKILITLIVSSFFILHSSFGQGALTPFGAPAPTMKTLAQIEPRTPISSAPFTIAQPGSYYLTTNLAVTTGDAITINASHVTLDLNGFAISSSDTMADPSGTGVLLNNTNAVPGQIGLHDIVIFNGVIAGGYTNNSGIWQGAGFNAGISFSGSVAPLNVRVQDVSISGCFNYGINVGLSGSVVESCVVQSVGSYGIYANSVSRSAATYCGNHAIIGREVSDSDGNCLGTGDGIYGVSVNNSYGTSVSGDGIYAQNSAQNSTGQSATGTGLAASGTVTGCYGTSTSSGGSGSGLDAGYTALNCFGSASGSGDGIDAAVAMNCVAFASGAGSGLSVQCANNCFGDNTGGGIGIIAYKTAIGCYVQSGSLSAYIANSCYGATETISYKYNMP